MDMTALVNKVKQHPDFSGAGMVLCHNGVVRGTTAEGDQQVTGLTVRVDQGQLRAVIARHQQLPGIIDIQVEIAEDRQLQVGDDIMLVVVAGDVRTHVIPAMTSLIDAIKAEVTSKTQVYV
ncbi:MAG: molybdenum cofactor biosynthesis protein MoaE [Thermodesulfobacteriota bacterium]|nr:molybdenum cofactor biosynthesis protein MoaE [Thermodesulfobacteriota bacterium]